jgi:hypothetical protein
VSYAALARTLDRIAHDCADLLDPWWLIGSAAAHLIGWRGPVKDVDLLTSRRDAETLLRRWNLAPQEAEPSGLFRSVLFAVWTGLPVPVEIMAELHVRGERLLPQSRRSVARGGGQLFVPDAAEQVAICRRFGREKDLARAAELRALV